MDISLQSTSFINETNIILNTNKPVIGICFGCEIIVTAFNGKLRRLDSPHVGLRNISIRNSDKENTVRNIQVYEHHQWIIDKAPDNFRIIAWTEDGPEMIRHNQLPIFGIQFHPENLTNQTDGDEIFFQILREINLI
jgi:anthranilate/para-aminobenzoate synthase component II